MCMITDIYLRLLRDFDEKSLMGKQNEVLPTFDDEMDPTTQLECVKIEIKNMKRFGKGLEKVRCFIDITDFLKGDSIQKNACYDLVLNMNILINECANSFLLNFWPWVFRAV